MLKRVGQAIEVSIEVVQRQEWVLMAQKKHEVMEETPPELSAATLWRFLEPNHPRYFGKCIRMCWHLQVAFGTVTNEDLPEGLRDSTFGEPLLASDGSVMGDDEFESAEL